MFPNSKPVSTVIAEACLIAKIMAALVMLAGTAAAIMALLKAPFKSAKWVSGISAFFVAGGAALMILVVYDNLCKAGYQKSVVVAFAMSFIASIVSIVTSAV